MTKHLLLLALLACNMATEAVAQESCCKKKRQNVPKRQKTLLPHSLVSPSAVTEKQP